MKAAIISDVLATNTFRGWSSLGLSCFPRALDDPVTLFPHHGAILLTIGTKRVPACIRSFDPREKNCMEPGCSAGTLALLVRRPDVELGGEDTMGFGRGALLWLLGVPLPIIILIALFWHH